MKKTNPFARKWEEELSGVHEDIAWTVTQIKSWKRYFN